MALTINQTDKKARYGQTLRQYRSQGIAAVGTLTSLKENLPILKTTISNDGDCDAADVEEVQAVIDELLTLISGI